MSQSGFHLCGLNFGGGFKFNVGEPKEYDYCFTYQKYENKKCGKDLKDWHKVAERDRWSIYRTQKSTSEKNMPNRRGLYLRNNSLLCGYALLSSIVLLAALGLVFGIFAFFSSGSDSYEVFFRKAVIIIGVFAVFLLGNFALFISMVSANNRILEEKEDPKVQENAYRQSVRKKTFENWLEKLLIKDGDIIKKLRPMALVSAVGLEKWLSRMESRGFNVYKVHKSGQLYYFTKGTPRKIRYCVVSSEGDNISRCAADGWQVIYSNVGHFSWFGRISILAKAYEGQPPLTFKSDREYVANAARIMAKFMISYFIALTVLIFAYLLFTCLKAAQAFVILAGAGAVFCTLLIVRELLYFAASVINSRDGRFKQNEHI